MKKQDKILEVCGDAQPETATQVENGATELVFILDKSGSMSGMERDVIGGFNAMIEKQKSVGGTAYVSTILFSNFSEVLHDRKNLEEIEPLTAQDFQVGGCTALLDAIGGAVNHIGNIHKYARKEDVPTKTVFIITTDGMENASTEYRKEEIKKLINRQEQQFGWEFLFVAANIDAVETAESLGIQSDHAANYCVEEDTGVMFSEMSETICNFRRTGKIRKDWADKIQKNSENKKN
jgi:uncharacterized protein YegL